MDGLGNLDVCHRRFQVVHIQEDFHVFSKERLHDLSRRADHQNKQKRVEAISLDDVILESNFNNIHLRPVRQPDLPSSHHLDDQHLPSTWESVYVQELFQKAWLTLSYALLKL